MMLGRESSLVSLFIAVAAARSVDNPVQRNVPITIDDNSCETLKTLGSSQRVHTAAANWTLGSSSAQDQQHSQRLHKADGDSRRGTPALGEHWPELEVPGLLLLGDSWEEASECLWALLGADLPSEPTSSGVLRPGEGAGPLKGVDEGCQSRYDQPPPAVPNWFQFHFQSKEVVWEKHQWWGV